MKYWISLLYYEIHYNYHMNKIVKPIPCVLFSHSVPFTLIKITKLYCIHLLLCEAKINETKVYS